MFLKVYGLQGLIIALFWRTFNRLKPWLKFNKTNGNNSPLSKAANAEHYPIKTPQKSARTNTLIFAESFLHTSKMRSRGSDTKRRIRRFAGKKIEFRETGPGQE